jgi:hypothetical protein
MEVGFPVLRCVMGGDKVASFDGLVAGRAGFVHRLIDDFAHVDRQRDPNIRAPVGPLHSPG